MFYIRQSLRSKAKFIDNQTACCGNCLQIGILPTAVHYNTLKCSKCFQRSCSLCGHAPHWSLRCDEAKEWTEKFEMTGYRVLFSSNLFIFRGPINCGTFYSFKTTAFVFCRKICGDAVKRWAAGSNDCLECFVCQNTFETGDQVKTGRCGCHPYVIYDCSTGKILVRHWNEMFIRGRYYKISKVQLFY